MYIKLYNFPTIREPQETIKNSTPRKETTAIWYSVKYKYTSTVLTGPTFLAGP